MRALLCLANWSDLELIKPEDTAKVVHLTDVEGEDSDYEMDEGWDAIDVSQFKK